MSPFPDTDKSPRRRRAVIAGALLAVIGFSSGAAAKPLPAASADVVAVIAAYNAHDPVGLPLPSEEELEQLMTGEVVKIRRRLPMTDSTGASEERIRIVGYALFGQPRLLIWLSALDIGQRHDDRLTEHLVWSDDAGDSLWYQYLKLPWPLKNRHWVIRNRKNTALAAATNDVAWEHAWRLEIGGQDTATRILANGEVAGFGSRHGKKAIYLPVNRGGWTMFDLDGPRVLVAAHVSTVLGGWIPDRVVANLVSQHLDRILSGLESRSQTIHERYDTDYPIFTGAATRITRSMAEDARRRAVERVAQP